jgi:hypothetical protein
VFSAVTKFSLLNTRVIFCTFNSIHVFLILISCSFLLILILIKIYFRLLSENFTVILKNLKLKLY